MTTINTRGNTNRTAQFEIGSELDCDNELYFTMTREFGSMRVPEHADTFLTKDEAVELANAILDAVGEGRATVTQLSRGDVRAIAAEVVDEKLRAAIGG